MSHLQFADDSLFLGEWLTSKAVNLMAMLEIFGEASGLKINLQKSRLFGVGVSEDINRLAARILCAATSLPFVYLGLLVGANMKRLAA